MVPNEQFTHNNKVELSTVELSLLTLELKAKPFQYVWRIASFDGKLVVFLDRFFTDIDADDALHIANKVPGDLSFKIKTKQARFRLEKKLNHRIKKHDIPWPPAKSKMVISLSSLHVARIASACLRECETSVNCDRIKQAVQSRLRNTVGKKSKDKVAKTYCSAILIASGVSYI